MGFPIPIIDGITKLIGKVVDKAVPDADLREKLKSELSTQIEQGNVDVELASIAHVNATMQAEAKSEHWMQWAWRPTVGFTFAFVIFNNYVLFPWAKTFGFETPMLVVPDAVWSAMLVVLGAAAATRGWEKATKKK